MIKKINKVSEIGFKTIMVIILTLAAGFLFAWAVIRMINRFN